MPKKSRSYNALKVLIPGIAAGFMIISSMPETEMLSAGEPAIRGFDTVAYFTDGKAVKGSAKYSHRWSGKEWRFSGRANLDRFASAPEKYAPRYNGYCAWAMTEGRKAVTDPAVWKIVDGRLYLNCSMNAYMKWSADIPGNIRKADGQWRQLKDKR
jgi:YHS domain-containing protein